MEGNYNTEKNKQYRCLGVSFKLWMERRKFLYFPRMGLKSDVIVRGKRERIRKHAGSPYHSYAIAWLWFDIVIYVPKF